MLDRVDISDCGLWVALPPQPAIAEMIRGMELNEAADFLPRIFNLCRMAQSVAIRMALGLERTGDADLASEIRKEHILRLAITLPMRLGLEPTRVADRGVKEMPGVLFGTERFPDSPAEFDSYVETDLGLAPMLRRIRDLFAPLEAVADLPTAWNGSVIERGAFENSAAARWLDHPVMRHVEASHGRGPLWRVTGRAIDLQVALDGCLPDPLLVAPGAAVVPAARGMYALTARAKAGRVDEFDRITPTDHLLASGGVLERSLASLSPVKHHLAVLVVDILDPCIPVQVKGVEHA